MNECKTIIIRVRVNICIIIHFDDQWNFYFLFQHAVDIYFKFLIKDHS